MTEITPTAEHWWVLALAGVFSILFGIVALAWPGITLLALVWLYGVFALVYGIVRLVGTFREIGAHQTWWGSLAVALLSLAAGIFVLAYPLMSTVVLAFVIAIWAIALGIVEVIVGISRAHWMVVLVGALSIVFGFIVLANPMAGALALVFVIGAFAIVRGIVEIVAAIRAPSARSAI